MSDGRGFSRENVRGLGHTRPLPRALYMLASPSPLFYGALYGLLNGAPPAASSHSRYGAVPSQLIAMCQISVVAAVSVISERLCKDDALRRETSKQQAVTRSESD